MFSLIVPWCFYPILFSLALKISCFPLHIFTLKPQNPPTVSTISTKKLYTTLSLLTLVLGTTHSSYSIGFEA